MGVVTLAACLSFGFTVKTNNTANVMFDTSSVDQIYPFDLSTNSDVVSHLSKLGSIAIDSATLTVETVNMDNTVTSVTGSLSMLPAGANPDAGCSSGIFVGTITNFAITAGNSLTVTIDGGSALSTYMSNLLKLPDGGNGPLAGAACVSGTSTGALPDGGVTGDFVLALNVVYNVSYDWP